MLGTGKIWFPGNGIQECRPLPVTKWPITECLLYSDNCCLNSGPFANHTHVCDLNTVQVHRLPVYSGDLGYYSEFLLKIVLQFLLEKTGARLALDLLSDTHSSWCKTVQWKNEANRIDL